jgi:uncharacterized protein YhaN
MRVSNAQRELSEWSQAEAKINGLRRDVEAWESDTRAFLSSLPGARDGDVAAALRQAAEEVEKALEAKRKSEEIARKIEESSASRTRSEEVARTAERTLADLFTRAGVSEEEAFRLAAQRFAQKKEVETLAAQDRAILNRSLGQGAEAEQILSALFAQDLSAYRAELLVAETEFRHLNNDVEEANQALGRIDGDLKTMERSADLAECDLKLQALRAEGNAAARRWRTLTLARSLLRTTLDEYTAQRQPEVLANASELFSACTAGRYPRVAQTACGDEIEVLRADGKKLSVDALSRGTREDLYVCLRLALAEQFGRRSGRLPFLADDVFVNFDPTRAQAALGALAQFAQCNQVVLFTCHPETVARVRRVAPDAAVRDLAEISRNP